MICQSLLLVDEAKMSRASYLSSTFQDEIHEEIQNLVHEGRLSSARFAAFHYLDQHYGGSDELRKALSTSFINAFDVAVSHSPTKYLYLDLLNRELPSDCDANKRLMSRRDLPDCVPAVPMGSSDPTHAWDACCSILPQHRATSDAGEMESNCAVFNPCCEFFVGSSSYLRLPALHEPALALRVDFSSITSGATNETANNWTMRIDLEQDGYLRLFDVAGILWPSGYLLAQCISNPKRCGIQDLLNLAWFSHQSISDGPFVMELGTGVGAPSIALTLYLQHQYSYDQYRTSPPVVATDVAPHSLALTLSNAWCNGARLTVDFLDYDNMSSILAAKERYYPAITTSEPTGFSVIMGSSLQSLFEDSHFADSSLWKALDLLLDRKNPHALAILVHTKSNPLVPPPSGSFDLVRHISGDRLEMMTRTGDSSDFEVFLFRRSKNKDQDL